MIKPTDTVPETETSSRVAIDAAELLRVFFERSDDAVLIREVDGTIIDCNPAAERLAGVVKEDWIGANLMDLIVIPPDQLSKVKHLLERSQRGEAIPPTELMLRRSDGATVNIETSSFPLTLSGRTVIMGIIRNITDRKQIQTALLENQARLSEAQEIGRIGDWSFDITTGRLIWSAELYRLMVRNPKLGPLSLREYLAACVGDDAQAIHAALKQAQTDGSESELDVRIQLPSGATAYHHGIMRGIRDASGRVVRLHGTVQDVTSLKVIERELRADKQVLDSIARNVGVGIAIISRDYKTLWANQVLKQHYGDVESKSCFTAYNGRDNVCPNCGVREVFEKGVERAYHEQRGFDVNGEEIWVEIIATPLRDSEGRLAGAVEAVVPITERKKAEAALAEEALRRRIFVEQSRDGIVVIDQDGEVREANPRFAEMLGYSHAEVLQLHVWDWDARWTREELLERLRVVGAAGERFETRHRRKDGSTIDVDISTTAALSGGRKLIFTVCRDITARKEAERVRQESLERQEELNRLQQALLGPGELKQKLQMVADGVVDIFGADFCRVWHIEPGDLCEAGCVHAGGAEGPSTCRDTSQCLHLLASSGRYTHTDGSQHSRIPLGAFKIGRVAAGDEHSFLTNDVGNDPRIQNPAWARECGLVSFAAYQLRPPEGETLGVLALFSAQPITPEEDAQLDALSIATAQMMRSSQAERALRESEQRYRTLFQNMLEGLAYCRMIYDEQGRPTDWVYLDVNAAFERLTGLRDVVGKKITEIFPNLREAAPELFEIYGRVATTGLPESFEIYFEPLSAWLNVSAFSPLSGHFVAIFENITDRKRFESSLKAQRDFLQQLIDTIPNPVYYCDTEKRYLGMNSAFESVVGATREELLGQTALSTSPIESPPAAGPSEPAVAESQGTRSYESPLRFSDGTWHDMIFHEAVFLGPDRRPAGIVGVMVDNTEQRKFMRALQDSESKFRALFEHSPEAAFLLTDRLIDCNERTCLLTGHPRENIIGRVATEFAPEFQPDGRPSRLVAAERVNAALEGEPQFFYWQLLKASGELADTEVLLNRITLHGRPILLGSLRDITERRRTEAGYRRLAAAVMQTAEGVVITDAEGVIEYVNPAFENMTQYRADEVYGKNPRILRSGKQDAEFYRAMWATLTSGQTWHGRLINLKKDGSTFTEELTISPIHDQHGKCVNYVGVKRDVSHEVALEQMLAQAQKMEAVGRLAGGIAHDFNNLLTVITGYSQILVQRLAHDEQLQGDVGEIKKAAERAAALTRQLLTFSRKEIGKRQNVDLGVLIKELSKMLRRLIGEDLELELNAAGEPLIVHADPGQLEQIVMNLAVNARDAMPHGGRLTLTVAAEQLAQALPVGRSVLQPGVYVKLVVTDTGTGMSDETLSHIFEPFFTTKEIGKGTGLGLATVDNLVHQLAGAIGVDSVCDRGTTFSIYLPSIVDPSRPLPTRELEAANRSKGETILLVEDDQLVRLLIERMLTELGYTVVTCEQSGQALEKAADPTFTIDLLLSDVIMPKLNGRELAERLHALRPAVKVLFMSGYPDNVISDGYLGEINAAYITKPFTREALGRKLRETLDAG